MLNKANITWNAKQIAKMAEKGTISFENAIQRGLVWDVKRKSLLIHSILMGYPIPPFYATKRNGVYDMLDGKQRSNAIIDFINDKYALKSIPDVQNPEDADVEEDINDLLFSELADEYKDIILSYSFTIYYYDGITDEQVNEMFYRLNNGKPLSAIELSRAKAKSLDAIRRLAKHELFTSTLTESSLAKYVADDLVIKSFVMMFTDTYDLSSKNVRKIIEEQEISDEQEKQLNEVFTNYYNLYQSVSDKSKKAGKKMIQKVNMLSLMPVMTNDIDLYKVVDFFELVPEEYANTCSNGTNSSTNVKARVEILKSNLIV